MGVARRRDIMRGLEPEFLVSKPLSARKNLFDVQLDPNLSEMSYDRLLKGVFERSKRPISDVMLPVVATINHDDHVTLVSKLGANVEYTCAILYRGPDRWWC